MSETITRAETRAETRSSKSGAPQKPKGVLHYLGMGISAGLFAVVLLVGMLVIVVPKLANALPLTVLTSSMEPGLPPGTLIVVKPIDTSDIAMGDVITYQIKSGEPGVITHRITGITNSSDGSRTFTLTGDNNDIADELQVLPVQVVGKLWYSVPWIGNVASFVNGGGKTWVVPVAASGLLLYAGFMIMSSVLTGIRNRRRRHTGDDARDAEVDAGRAAEIDSAEDTAKDLSPTANSNTANTFDWNLK